MTSYKSWIADGPVNYLLINKIVNTFENYLIHLSLLFVNYLCFFEQFFLSGRTKNKLIKMLKNYLKKGT